MKTAGRDTRRMPEDVYKGADKARIKGLILKSWKKQFPDSHVLAVRFPYGWVRNQGQYEKDGRTWPVDYSELFVFVVAKTDAAIATIYPCRAYKDNVLKDGLSVSATMEGSGSYVPNQMLIKNVK